MTADQIAQAIEMEGPDSVAAVFIEPVQNAGGCLTPPPGYLRRVREICDHYGVLLVSDEVICAYGRLGHMFGCDRYDYVPDIITTANPDCMLHLQAIARIRMRSRAPALRHSCGAGCQPARRLATAAVRLRARQSAD